jgi:hypothetical protein
MVSRIDIKWRVMTSSSLETLNPWERVPDTLNKKVYGSRSGQDMAAKNKTLSPPRIKLWYSIS